jgi:hypothetical protein
MLIEKCSVRIDVIGLRAKIPVSEQHNRAKSLKVMTEWRHFCLQFHLIQLECVGTIHSLWRGFSFVNEALIILTCAWVTESSLCGVSTWQVSMTSTRCCVVYSYRRITLWEAVQILLPALCHDTCENTRTSLRFLFKQTVLQWTVPLSSYLPPWHRNHISMYVITLNKIHRT